jgi:F-type H+-transporting ATPase subunit epsilon
MSEIVHLSVISHDGELFSEKVSFVKVFTDNGEVGIYPDHTSMVTTVRHTDVVYELTNQEKSHSFYVSQGILSISNNRVVILTDTMILHDDLNKKKITESLDNAKQLYAKSTIASDRELQRDIIIMEEAKLRVIENH